MRSEDELEGRDDFDGSAVEKKWPEAPVLDRLYRCGAYIDGPTDDPGAGHFTFFGDVDCNFYSTRDG